MTQGGSNKIKIKLNVATGELEKITDEKNNPATVVAEAEIEQIFQNQGFKYLGDILQAQSNPTCVYVRIGGKARKICF